MLQDVIIMCFDEVRRLCMLSFNFFIYYEVFRCQVCLHGTQIQQLFNIPAGERQKVDTEISAWKWIWFVRQELYKVTLRAHSRALLSACSNPLSLDWFIYIIPLLCSSRSFPPSHARKKEREKWLSGLSTLCYLLFWKQGWKSIEKYSRARMRDLSGQKGPSAAKV